MKRTWLGILVAIMVALIAVPAYAGVMSTIKSSLSGGAIIVVSNALIALVFTFLGGKRVKWQLPTREMRDVGVKAFMAIQKNSPGGKTITDDEWREIGREIVDVAKAFAMATGEDIDPELLKVSK